MESSIQPSKPDATYSAQALHILLVDDHGLFRDGFRLILERLWQDPLNFVDCETAAAGLEAMSKRHFDFIFLDLQLPDCDGLDCISAFRAAAPVSCLVVVSAVANAEVVRQAMKLGVRGYVPKSSSTDSIRSALQAIRAGDVLGLGPAEIAQSDRDNLERPLTRRQLEVLIELGQGASNRNIAERLFMSENTVRVHLHSIFRLLGAKSRTQAVAAAKKRGLC